LIQYGEQLRTQEPLLWHNVLIPGNGICLTVPLKANKRAIRAVCKQTAVVCKQTAQVSGNLYRAKNPNKFGFSGAERVPNCGTLIAQAISAIQADRAIT